MEKELLSNFIMVFFIGFILGRIAQHVKERVIRERDEPDTNPPQERSWNSQSKKTD